MRRWTIPILTALLLVVPACTDAAGRPGESAGRYARNGEFTLAVSSDPGAFDPYQSSLIFGQAYLAYDSLVNLRADGRFVSGLAQSWTADNRSATFKLRPNITCSDGTQLTASQVATAITYVSDPKNHSPQYGVSVPAQPLKATPDDSAGTVTITMEKSFGFLLNTVGQLPIVCAKGLQNPKLLRSASYGTGPFVLTKVVPGQSYTFTVRRGYTWGPGGASTSAPGTPATVVLRVVPNETTAANLLLSGEVEFAGIIGDDQRRLAAQGLKRVESPLSGAWLWFNQLAGRPGAQPNVRKALVQALDLDKIIKINTGGTGRASTGLVAMKPQPCPGDTVSGTLPGYDMTAAAALLEQAGWVKGVDGVRRKAGRTLTLDLHYVQEASTYERPTAEYVSAQWKALGAKVNLRPDTWARWSTVMFETGDYDVYLVGFNVNLPNQMVKFLSGPAPPKGSNVAGLDNKDYNALAAKAGA